MIDTTWMLLHKLMMKSSFSLKPCFILFAAERLLYGMNGFSVKISGGGGGCLVSSNDLNVTPPSPKYALFPVVRVGLVVWFLHISMDC